MAMNFPRGIESIITLAREAVARDNIRLSGCWSEHQRGGRVYRGGVFEHEGVRWAACRGPQRPLQAQLLDATACFKFHEKAAHAVALLDPPADKFHHKYVPDRAYRVRARAAAWHGLGIVWTTGDKVPDVSEWPDIARGTQTEGFDEIADEVERAVRDAATAEWTTSKKSRQAEKFVRPVLDRMLGVRGYRATAQAFPTFWRKAETDGAWQRPGASPKRIALEVKVDEDDTAPFCQVVDDLGSFDAVVQVRLLLNESVRYHLHGRAGVPEVRERFANALPVKLIELRFCDLCKQPLLYPGFDYPYLICEACDGRAVNAAGNSPGAEGWNDDGENPVWVGGQKCWRRYRFGGWITMHDPDDCATLEAFYKRNKGG